MSISPTDPETFSRQTAASLAKLCWDSYLDHHGFSARWSGDGKIHSWSIEGAVAYAVEMESDVVLVFRGSDDPGDWLSNLNSRLVSAWPWLPNRVEVHAGFLSEWESMIESICDTLPAGKRLWLTGHSLGGALAVISGVSMKRLGFQPVAVYSFGAPRVGGKGFSRLGGPPHWRVVASSDPVPHLPPALAGFRHSGSLRFLDGTGKVKFRVSWLDWLKSTLGDWVLPMSGHSVTRYVNLLEGERETMNKNHRYSITASIPSDGRSENNEEQVALSNLGVVIPEGEKAVALVGSSGWRDRMAPIQEGGGLGVIGLAVVADTVLESAPPQDGGGQ